MFEKDPRTFGDDYDKLSPDGKAIVKLEITLTKFFRDFDRSVRRWERLIYPMVIVLGVLGLSGFYLILNVTRDMHQVAQHVDPDMESNLDAMAGHMGMLSANISAMTFQFEALVETVGQMDSKVGLMAVSLDKMDNNVGVITENVVAISNSVGVMREAVVTMSTNVAELNASAKYMSGNVGAMSQDMRVMNNNVSRPMNFMNSMMPW